MMNWYRKVRHSRVLKGNPFLGRGKDGNRGNDEAWLEAYLSRVA